VFAPSNQGTIEGLALPTTDYQAANKKYVDNLRTDFQNGTLGSNWGTVDSADIATSSSNDYNTYTISNISSGVYMVTVTLLLGGNSDSDQGCYSVIVDGTTYTSIPGKSANETNPTLSIPIVKRITGTSIIITQATATTSGHTASKLSNISWAKLGA
jgi:hypothetical protein